MLQKVGQRNDLYRICHAQISQAADFCVVAPFGDHQASASAPDIEPNCCVDCPRWLLQIKIESGGLRCVGFAEQ
jgi:hypothetical protein